MSPLYLLVYLRVIGGASLLAFGAALMPGVWIVEISQWLGWNPFPDSPLTFYLARNLSLLYGYVGVFVLIIAADLPRYRPLVRWAAIGTMSFGVLQFIVDSMAGAPAWWTYSESGWAFFGGGLLAWLDARTSKDTVS